MIYDVKMRTRYRTQPVHGGYVIAVDDADAQIKAQERVERNIPFCGPAYLESVTLLSEEQVVDLLENTGYHGT